MMDSIKEKKKALLDEIDKLREEYQVELPKRIAEARSQGDLSENAEYDAARERQGFLKARIAQMTHLVSQYNDVSLSHGDEKSVGFGSVVVVLELNSNTRAEYTIVHPIEVEPSEGKISLASPVGRALQNHTVGEEVVVTVPSGEKRFFIEKITSMHGTIFTA
jgi:transcription elongation factor GreA